MFGRQKLPYSAGFAVYQVAKRFKKDFLVSDSGKAMIQRRFDQAAAPTTRGLQASATSTTPAPVPTAIVNASATGLKQESLSPPHHKHLLRAGQPAQHPLSTPSPALSINGPIKQEVQSPESRAVVGMGVSQLNRIIELANTIRDQASAISVGATNEEWEAMRTNQAELQEILRLPAHRNVQSDAWGK